MSINIKFHLVHAQDHVTNDKTCKRHENDSVIMMHVRSNVTYSWH